MDSGGLSDHRKAVALYLKGRDSSLDSSSPSFNGGLLRSESRLLIQMMGNNVLSMSSSSAMEESVLFNFY